LGGLHGLVDVGGSRERRGRVCLAGRRVYDVERLSVALGLELAVDVVEQFARLGD
jgi:hypothetical protein